MLRHLDDFTRGYLEAALWTSDPEPGSGEWCEREEWCIDRIDPNDLARAIEVCRDFQHAQSADLAHAGSDAQNGHDFWLTRNGHGAGFWDRGYGALGDRLSEACRPYGEVYVYGPETEDNGSATPEAWDRWDGVIHLED